MAWIILFNLIAVCWLCATVSRKGFEETLPVAAFLLMLFPAESQFHIPGVFDLTTQRVVVITLIVLYFMKGQGEGRGILKGATPLKHLMVLIVVWMLIASANSVVPDVSFKSTLSQCFDFFVPYYIFARTISKAETVEKILFAFVSSMFVCSMFGALELYFGWSVTSIFPPLSHRFDHLGGGDLDRGIRVQSTFAHAILFGSALALVIPMALCLLETVKTSGRKIFLWSAILLMVLCIYKTASRGPWMALALSLGLLLVLGRGRIRKYLMVIGLLTAFVLIARPGVWRTIADLYYTTLDPNTAQGESYQWRYALLNVAKVELAKSTGRSLWGYGPESFYYLGITTEFLTNGEMHTVKVESCDSAIVELMMDSGYVGLLLMGALLLKASLIALWGYFKTSKSANLFCLLFFVNIAAYCFLMTNVELFGWGQQSYMLWIVIALAVVYPRIVQSSRVVENNPQLVSEMSDALA
jgi:O-Antigen ligase